MFVVCVFVCVCVGTRRPASKTSVRFDAPFDDLGGSHDKESSVQCQTLFDRASVPKTWNDRDRDEGSP